MYDLIGVCELIKEVYYKVLKYSEVHTEKHKISKTFEIITQYIFHEDNRACLKFYTVTKISTQTKHIATPYQLFQTDIKQIEIKVVAVRTDN